MIGSAPFLMQSSVIMIFSTVGSLGILYIRSLNAFSRTLLKPLAPVFLSSVISATALSVSI